MKIAVKEQKPLRVIQRKGWSTSNRDPGDTCPKCGGSMHYSKDDDTTIFCINAMGGGSCDFQYSFTERELERNANAFYAQWDQEAVEDTRKYVQERGRLVFGEVNPGRFVLPSAKYREPRR